MSAEYLSLENLSLEPQSGTALTHRLKFRKFLQPELALKMWLFSAAPGESFFPWFSYNPTLDEDIKTLGDLWHITTAESFFDFLFLLSIYKMAGPNLYFVFPGNLRRENWINIKEGDRQIFLKGQGCIYHLQGTFTERLSIQWAPYWQPQSLVKNPYFTSLWNLFRQIPPEDDARSLTFFSLSDPKKLPQVVSTLIDPTPKRSEHIAGLVDWFGLYSSPVQSNVRTGCVVYSQNEAALAPFASFEERLRVIYEQAFKAIQEKPEPKTVIRFTSRLSAF